MSYEKLDGLILERVNETGCFFVGVIGGDVRKECERIADLSNRDRYRVLDGRLQALKKAGKIAYTSKAGWALV